MSEMADRLAKLSPAQRQLLEQRLQRGSQKSQPIAVVGMACRFPGAGNVEEFWELIANRTSGVTEVPEDRWDVDEYYDPDPDVPGKMATRWGAFLDNIGEFDSVFFGIAPREAGRMDPQQRLLLEVSWEALENAGIAPKSIAGTATGVFIGIGGSDYAKVAMRYPDYWDLVDPHVGTGNALSIASNRISYIMDLRGPSVSVDTACSSGLVGVHLAAQSLQRGESDVALAGAVNLVLTPDVSVAFSKARMLSPTGQCRPFDAAADGYVRGEGCAIVVLKRLTDATRAGDNILAVIRGSAVNQDGRTSGITAPNSLSQISCIQAALASAGLTNKDVTYIEAHGTGTPLGDPIEFQSLSKIYPRTAKSEPDCYVSSVKSLIGHTETVSGVAGAIKVILMLQRGVIPSHGEFRKGLNENIKLEGTRLVIPDQSAPWDGRRVAGVSSFGFGGTNSHIILEQAPTVESKSATSPERPCHIATVSAKSSSALENLVTAYADRLETLDDGNLADFCHATNADRSHFHHRFAAVAASRKQLIEQLRKTAAGKRAKGGKKGEVRLAQKPKVAFMFTGQGSQYPDMARQLYEGHPVFRAAIDRCDKVFQECRGESLLSIFFTSEGCDGKRVHDTANTQPALLAVEYAMAELWRSWGIEPGVMLGHSVGEYAAACIAGVFTIEDGMRLISKRAELMDNLPRTGSMAVIFTNRERVAQTLAAYDPREISIGTANGPENNAISGKTEVVEQVVAEFEKQGVGTQRVTVSHAFHSPLMDPMLDEFSEFAQTLTYSRPRVPIIANRTGELVDSASFDAAYWRDHLRNCVEFEKSMDCLADQSPHALLEVGPNAILLGMGRRCRSDLEVAWVPCMRKGRDDWETLLGAAVEMYVAGFELNWQEFDTPWPRRHIMLPNYPFERSYMWLETKQSSATSFGKAGPSLHPLLGSRLTTALDMTLTGTRFSADSPSFLRDHQVQGSAVVPAAAYLEQALAMANQVFGEGRHGVENLSIQQAMFLPVEGYRAVQVTASAEMGGRSDFEVLSIGSDNDDVKARWQPHANGRLVHADVCMQEEPPAPIDMSKVRTRLNNPSTRDEFYDRMRERGLPYGPSFQVIGNSDQGTTEALFAVEIANDSPVRDQLNNYYLHPAVGDACMQTIAGVIPLEKDGSYSPFTYMPVGIRKARTYHPITDEMYCYAVRISPKNETSPERLEANVYLLNASGEVLVSLEGVLVQRVGTGLSSGDSGNIQDWLYRYDWLEQSLAETNTAVGGRTLVFCDESGVGERLATQLREAGSQCHLVQVGEKFAAGDDLSRVRADQIGDYEQLLKGVCGDSDPTCDRIIHLWSLDAPATAESGVDGLQTACDLCCASPLTLLKQVARTAFKKPPQVWFVTRGGQCVGSSADATVNAEQTALWGMGRVAALEHPELNVRLVDIAPDMNSQEAAASLGVEIASAADENQVALRGDSRFVARIVRTSGDGQLGDAFGVPANGPFRLRITSSGSFDGLRYEKHQPPNCAAGQVEIKVQATGLNFSDVLKAMGLYPGITDAVVPVGIECSGVITKVGGGVDRFQIGDEVMGVAPYSFASHAVTTDYALVKKPKQLDYQEAATVPVTFLTAYYALVRLAGLQQGERVLIHAGAGGVGLAAIQIAKHIGAEIFATAGSDEKREFLTSLGVHHVMNSRTLDFADEILDITSREGVDVVLNSLPGDAITKSLSVLRAYGRFLEIGKTDIYQNSKIGLLPFQDNLSYFAIDLDRMLRQRPDYIRELFAEVIQYFESGDYTALPFTQFPADETVDAFRYMAQRKNIGKIVVTMASDQSEPTTPTETPGVLIRADVTYLITGGLGALGRQIARWLGDQGAKYITLMSRREPAGAAVQDISALHDRDVNAVAIQGDVAEADSLRSALESIPGDFPPIGGIFHAAGVLADGVLFDMDLDQLFKPLRPKVQGTWNLHQATADQQLDMFVLFSSVASALGSPGQGNYAAANAYLDGFAAWRRSQGLAATSINWGPWADSGMAAEAGRDKNVTGRGMNPLPADKALEVMKLLLRSGQDSVAVMFVAWEELLKSGRVPPMLREIASTVEQIGGAVDSAEDIALRSKLLEMTVPQRQEKLSGYFAEQLASIMGLETEDIDVSQPLSEMGLDSLMAIELKNKIENRLKIVLPMSVFMQEPSVTTLATHVAETYGAEAGQGGVISGNGDASNKSPTTETAESANA